MSWSLTHFLIYFSSDRQELHFHKPLQLVDRDDNDFPSQLEIFPVRQLSQLILANTLLPDCNNKTYCLEVIESNDATYNFMVGGDGRMYEVRGWNFISGLHDLDSLESAFVIGFIGEFFGFY